MSYQRLPPSYQELPLPTRGPPSYLGLPFLPGVSPSYQGPPSYLGLPFLPGPPFLPGASPSYLGVPFLPWAHLPTSALLPTRAWSGNSQKMKRATICLITGVLILIGASRWHSGKESACQRRRHKRHSFNPWLRKIPWRRKGQPTPVFLPGKSHGQRSLLDYSPWGRKELDMTERLHFTSLQRKISTYKSDNSKYKRN